MSALPDWLTDPDYRTQLLTAALGYAERGWHVFPLRPRSKRPAVPNHPAHGCDGTDPRCAGGHTGWEARATTDPDRITRAWTMRPYGIGIACGPSGLLVVDLDTASEGGPSGVESYSRLAHHKPVVITRVVATPSGGRHRYYTRPTGTHLGNTVSLLGPRVDTRANGGYVVAPPTRLGPDGARYWVTCGTPPAPAPDWLIEALTTPAPHPAPARHNPTLVPGTAGGGRPEAVRRYVDAALDGSAAQLQAVTTIGARNRTLFEVARSLGQLIAAGALDQPPPNASCGPTPPTTSPSAAAPSTSSPQPSTPASTPANACPANSPPTSPTTSQQQRPRSEATDHDTRAHSSRGLALHPPQTHHPPRTPIPGPVPRRPLHHPQHCCGHPS